MSKYIDDKEVVSSEDGLVTFTDGTTKKYSTEWAEYLTREEVKDDFMFHKVSRLAGNVLKELVDGCFNSYEQERLLDVIQTSIQKANQDDICKRYGVEDPRYISFDQINNNLIDKK